MTIFRAWITTTSGAAADLPQGFWQWHRGARGDALLTVAFEIVSHAKPGRSYDMSTLLRELAVAAGSRKLIAGQVADLEAEGKATTRDDLRFIHENKTAAILTASVCLGAMSANAPTRELSAITKFGRALGVAFQVIDDILDVTQTSEKLGKSAGKDIAAKKATYPSIIGLEESRAEARRLTRRARQALDVFGRARRGTRVGRLSSRAGILSAAPTCTHRRDVAIVEFNARG